MAPGRRVLGAPWFWARVLEPVRDRFPDALFLGEVIHDDYAEFVKESTVDSVTQYELWKAIWSSLLDRNLFELQWTLGRNNELLDTFVPNTFVGNHDVTRIATTEVTAIENERMTYRTIERGGERWIEVRIDLAGTPMATISASDGSTLWQGPSCGSGSPA